MKFINDLLNWKVEQMMHKIAERDAVIREIKYH